MLKGTSISMYADQEKSSGNLLLAKDVVDHTGTVVGTIIKTQVNHFPVVGRICWQQSAIGNSGLERIHCLFGETGHFTERLFTGNCSIHEKQEDKIGEATAFQPFIGVVHIPILI